MASVVGRRACPEDAVSEVSEFDSQRRKRLHVDREDESRSARSSARTEHVPEGADTVLRRVRRAGSPIRPALRPVVYLDKESLLKTLTRMIDDERQQLEGRRARTEYAAVRRTVADWVLDLQKAFQLSTATVALAIQYFDTVVASMSVPPSELESTIAACVLIAYKFQEPDIEVATRITLTLLSECCEGGVTPSAIKRQEGVVLARGLVWNLNRLSAAHFLDTLLALTADPDAVADSRWLAYVNTVASQMLMLALRDDHFVAVAPSVAAAACVWAARRLIGADLAVASPAAVAAAPEPELPAHVLAALRLGPDTVAPLADRLAKLFDVGSVMVAMPQTPAPTTPGARPSPGCITDM